MISPNIERLYAQIRRHILLAQSYTEVAELTFIIKACRLKPYSYLFESKNAKLVLHRWWVDEFGNSFKIIKNKRIRIIYNDLELDKDKIVCTDLYHGLSLDRVARTSKLVHLSAGRDDDFNDHCFFITFLGIDNYLRSYMQLYGEWQQVSPLLLGMRSLKNIAKHADIKYFHEFSNKENTALPCERTREWISFMPASKEFLLTLEKPYDKVFSFLELTKENNPK
jgi:hypothetical protein